MNGKLPEEKLNELLPGLGRLAELVCAGETLDRQAFRGIALSIGIDGLEWALAELELWSHILVKSKDPLYNEDAIVAELRSRGIPEFPAMLACKSAKPKPMTVEPQFIDFGCLKIGERAESRTLTVSGERVKKAEPAGSPRLKVTLKDSGPTTTLVKVQLSNGAAGETVKDEIILRGSTCELRIPVTARWEAEPPLLSWCPECKIDKKSLFYNQRERKYECLNLACKHEFPYPDKRVNQYNDTHR